VDEVEVIARVCPFEVHVFDLEVAVWGNEGGLDRGEVGADYVCGRVQVSYFAGRGVSGCGPKREGWGKYIAQIPVPVPRSRMFCDRVVSGG